MPRQFTVSPDFNASQVPPWFVFNNTLQHILVEPCHLELYDGFDAMRAAVSADKVDIIYANAFDTAILVRERGFLPVATGRNCSDEVLVATHKESFCGKVTELPKPIRIACTDSPDVEMIGRILLEPADIGSETIQWVRRANYVMVAKELIQQGADVGFFLKSSFDELSSLVKGQLKPVVDSHIYVVQHALLVAPALADKIPQLQKGLLEMKSEQTAELGLQEGWEAFSKEQAEFMIDLINTLLP